MKLSNSSINRFLECGRSYKLFYKDRIHSKYKSSALFFGSAFDLAVNELLKGNSLEDAIKTFKDSWAFPVERDGTIVDLKEHVYVTYYDSDFDYDLLDQASIKTIREYAKNTNNNTDIIEFMKQQKDKRKDDTFKTQDESFIKYFNLVNWYVLNNKGEYMLHAYRAQLLPRFKRVLAIQEPLVLTSACGDTVEGILDLVAELHDGSIAIIDNKTSSMDYTKESVRLSQQLALYKVILNNMHSEGKFPHKIDNAGYAVIKKRPNKVNDRTCTKCGFKSAGKHATCNNEVDGNRCHGVWDSNIKLTFETQFIVDNISEDHEELVLDTVNSVNSAINNNIFQPNLSSCIGKFGKCAYYDYCHRGKTMDGLYILEEKTNNEQKETK